MSYKWSNLYKLITRSLCATVLVAMASAPIFAQSKVIRVYPYTTDVKGVYYFLPKTELLLSFDVEESQFTPGELSAYAGVLLGKKAVLSPSKTFKITHVTIETVGVANENLQFSIEFKPDTPTSFVALSPEGLLRGINCDGLPTHSPTNTPPQTATGEAKPSSVSVALPREYAQATSLAMRAKIASGHLFSLREDLLDLLSGKAENAPRQGEAFTYAVKLLKEQIEATEALFYGTTTTRTTSKTFQFEPPSSATKKSIAGFSSDRGLTSAGNPSQAITLSFTPTEVKDNSEVAEGKKLEGIVYNIPGKAQVVVTLPNGDSFTKQVNIAQLGTQATLAKNINRTKKDAVAITFDPRSGSLIEIKSSSPQP